MSGFSRWTVDDMTIEPQIVNEVVIQLPDVSTIGLGDVVEQRCFQSETQALHEELLSYWTPTWQAMSTVEPSTWNWVIAFSKLMFLSSRCSLVPFHLTNGLEHCESTEQMLLEELTASRPKTCSLCPWLGL